MNTWITTAMVSIIMIIIGSCGIAFVMLLSQLGTLKQRNKWLSDCMKVLSVDKRALADDIRAKDKTVALLNEQNDQLRFMVRQRDACVEDMDTTFQELVQSESSPPKADIASVLDGRGPYAMREHCNKPQWIYGGWTAN